MPAFHTLDHRKSCRCPDRRRRGNGRYIEIRPDLALHSRRHVRFQVLLEIFHNGRSAQDRAVAQERVLLTPPEPALRFLLAEEGGGPDGAYGKRHRDAEVRLRARGSHSLRRNLSPRFYLRRDAVHIPSAHPVCVYSFPHTGLSDSKVRQDDRAEVPEGAGLLLRAYGERKGLDIRDKGREGLREGGRGGKRLRVFERGLSG